MKRFQSSLKSPLPLPSKPPFFGWGVALVGAIAAGLATPATALAGTLNWADPGVVWPQGSLQEEYVINGVTVRLTWTANGGSTIDIITDDPGTLPGFTGGFTPDIFKITFDSAAIADNVSLLIEYEDAAGNPVPVENARLILLDIDRSPNDDWQDLVTASGSLGAAASPITVSPATTPPPSPPITTPAASAGDYTVDLTGTSSTSLLATGIYPPVPPGSNAEADNSSPNGNVVVDFDSAVDQISLVYGNGPLSPADPDSHGIGLFNVFFQPAVIGIAKQAGTPVANAGGTFTVPYTLVVQNFGETPLSDVQVVEDLTATFASAGGFTVSNPQLVGPLPPGFTGAINPAFDGTAASSTLLTGTAADRTLAVGASFSITFDVEITPGTGAGGLGPFNNTAVTTAQSPSGAPVTDESTNGTDPDPNGDNSPVENTPTPVDLTPALTPAIGVAKRVVGTQPVVGDADALDITYEILVQNFGGEALNTVQLVEDLIDPTTGAPTYGVGNYSIVGAPVVPPGSTLTINPAYDGLTDLNLLDAASSTLAVGASSTVQITVRVDDSDNAPPLPAFPGTYNNQVNASGVGQISTAPVSDLSTNGISPDPDGDGNPNNNASPTPFQLPLTGDLQLVKRVTNIFRNGNPLTAAEIGGDPTSVINDGTTTADDDLIAATGGQLPVGLVTVPNNLAAGDQVEYTVYFFNDGFGSVTDVQLCDEFQPPSVFVPGSLVLAAPVALPGPLGAFNPSALLDPRDPLTPLEASCPNAPGAFPSGPPGPSDPAIGIGAGGGFIFEDSAAASGITVLQSTVGAIRFRIELP
ncbi:hypothetical protein C7271_11875 [filamentous cyanobacterium CCP5]|nr:hypothetical protein C7271_11875 [filamentous cyanobacterium CCP5]